MYKLIVTLYVISIQIVFVCLQETKKDRWVDG